MSSFTKPFKVIIHNVSLNEKPFEINEDFEFYFNYKNRLITIHIPKGYRSNFASVPRIFWSLFPPVGRYSKATVVHDWLLDGSNNMNLTYHGINKAFLEAMKVLGVNIITRWIMFLAVDFYWYVIIPIKNKIINFLKKGFGGWFLILPVFVILISIVIINMGLYRSIGTSGDLKYKDISKSIIDELMPEFEQIMIDRGYTRSNYKNEVHDCDDYSIAGVAVLHELLERERKAGNIPDDNAYPIFQFSFRRDDGKRHRLFFVSTDKGRVYIDNWRINGSMYRKLSSSEEANGYVIF